MDYPEALDWLYSTQLFGVKLGLETIRRLLGALDYQFDERIIHVAGTNGKGSVCAMAAAICDAQGYRTALFTSPHLVTFCERIRIDSHPIPERAVALGLTRLRELSAGWEPSPTFFEFTTALALDWFRQMNAEVIVLETGLGGRLDATNAVMPAVSVLTAIDFDHTAWLGDTLEAIAGEKAGIIKPGIPVVSAPQEPEAAEVIARAASAAGSTLHVVSAPVPVSYKVGLAGSHQRLNAALALAALDAAGISADEKARHAGLANVDWPGRFQRLENGRIVLDGAHNPAAARRLARTWHEEYGDHHRATIILGILRDKDAEAICRALGPLAARFIAVPVRSPRTLAAAEVCSVLSQVAPGVPAETAADFDAALEIARSAPETILVTGSLFLAGEALAALGGKQAPEASWQ
jgi:dihydrofolate synthase/folylpolyglutamate synthase